MGIKQFRKGTDFENEFARLLSSEGYWALVIPKAKDGSQPFDIVAQKDGKAYNFDCKTLESLSFPLSRVEENQEKAFCKLESCGCHKNYFAIKVKSGQIYICEASIILAFKNAGDKSISPRDLGLMLEEWIENENNGR